MSGPEFILAVVAVACVTGLLKKWMEVRYSSSNIGSDKKFEELQQAFSQHRQEMKKRVENLEAIIAEDEDMKADYRQIEAPSQNTLTNDLQQKEQVSS